MNINEQIKELTLTLDQKDTKRENKMREPIKSKFAVLDVQKDSVNIFISDSDKVPSSRGSDIVVEDVVINFNYDKEIEIVGNMFDYYYSDGGKNISKEEAEKYSDNRINKYQDKIWKGWSIFHPFTFQKIDCYYLLSGWHLFKKTTPYCLISNVPYIITFC